MTTRQKTTAAGERVAKLRTSRTNSRAAPFGAPVEGPETPFPLRQAIAEAAYYKAERRGFAPGGEVEDWLEAERELRAAQQPKASKRTSKRTTRAKPVQSEAVLQA
jgi:hypothetical protein